MVQVCDLITLEAEHDLERLAFMTFAEKAAKLKKIFVVLLTRESCSVRATAYLSKS